MSLSKRFKSRKLQSLVIASVLAFNFSSNVEATPYQPPFSISYDGFNVATNGDFGGYREVDLTNLDYSREFTIQLPTSDIGIKEEGDAANVRYSYLYHTPVDKTIYIDGNAVTLKAGQLYFIDRQIESGHVTDTGVTLLGDADRILSGGLSEDEIKDLIHNVEGDMTVDGSQDITGDQNVDGEQTVKSAFSI